MPNGILGANGLISPGDIELTLGTPDFVNLEILIYFAEVTTPLV